MSPTPSRFVLTRRMLPNCCAWFILSLAATTSQAQMGGIESPLGDSGLGGSNQIEGRIYYPSNRPVDRRIKVRISSVRGGESFTLSDDNGAFTFRRLTGGTYQIAVEPGREYETAYETVEFRNSLRQQPQVTYVEIRLRPKVRGEAKPAVVDAALADVPKPALEIYQKALAAAQAGDTRGAVEQLKRAIQIHPRFVQALNILGVQHTRLGEFSEAVAAFRNALAVAPDALMPRLNYGIVLLQQKKYAEAEAEFSRALTRNDASAVVHLYRGRTLIYLKRYDEAEKELHRVISLGSNSGEAAMAHRYLGALYKEQGENKRAVEALEKYLQLVPKAADAAQIREIIDELQKQASAAGK